MRSKSEATKTATTNRIKATSKYYTLILSDYKGCHRCSKRTKIRCAACVTPICEEHCHESLYFDVMCIDCVQHARLIKQSSRQMYKKLLDANVVRV